VTVFLGKLKERPRFLLRDTRKAENKCAEVVEIECSGDAQVAHEKIAALLSRKGYGNRFDGLAAP
jgi:hypothetical protein